MVIVVYTCSMSLSARTSSSLTKLMATPLRPKRPDRPMRCMYSSRLVWRS